jgi:hypothetical protein
LLSVLFTLDFFAATFLAAFLAAFFVAEAFVFWVVIG